MVHRNEIEKRKYALYLLYRIIVNCANLSVPTRPHIIVRENWAVGKVRKAPNNASDERIFCKK